MNRQTLLRTVLVFPFALGVAGTCSSGSPDTFDVASYLETQCKDTNLNLDTAKFEVDLLKDKKIKVNDYTITAEGSGRIATHIPPVGAERGKTLSSNGNEVYLKESGVEYTVTSKAGEGEITHISVSRSCERS